MKPQIPCDYYYNRGYDNLLRFISYWYQLNNLFSISAETVLEIGIGNGLISDYLKKRKFNIFTMDVDIALKPDILGSISSIPFCDNSFDAVLCYEVLEHLPFSKFGKALKEMYRISRSWVLLSLPDNSWYISINIAVPWLNEINIFRSFPRLLNRVHKFDGEHYWEIGKAGYGLRTIINEIEKSGFSIQDTYRIKKHPYHRFFFLKK